MSFNARRDIAACRKARRCHWCGERIEVGQPAVRIVGQWDGDFGWTFWHPECDLAFMAMDWKARESYGVDESFDRGLFKRGALELR